VGPRTRWLSLKNKTFKTFFYSKGPHSKGPHSRGFLGNANIPEEILWLLYRIINIDGNSSLKK
jgi:hypothetical protein